jgi:hypothetical protein
MDDRPGLVVLCCALAVLLLTPGPAQAAWPSNPFVNLPVCTAAGGQGAPAVVSDGAGGIIVCWEDYRGSSGDIYVQHVLASGAVDPVWPANGLALCTAAGSQVTPRIATDGAGGAIVVWEDNRVAGNSDIYAQHALASGEVNPDWPVDGLALCTAAGQQRVPRILSDDSGGAIVVWQDSRGSSWDIYAQRALAPGIVDPAWPADGRALCSATGEQEYATCVPDGAGGAVVTWQDSRAGNLDIYGQHVLVSGAVDPVWPADGRALCTATGTQGLPSTAPDGAGGAIVAWYDFRGGPTNDIYAQHVVASGVVDYTWPTDGRALCTAAGYQAYPVAISDGAGGAIVAWHDQRGGNYDIYAQHVQATGDVDALWPSDGRALCAQAGDQTYPRIISDGAGGAIVAWTDNRVSASDVYAQHVTASGIVEAVWPTNGRSVSTAAMSQWDVALASDGMGGAVVAWCDYRAANYDVYAQRVARFGYLGTPEAEISSAKDVPNDQGGRVKLSWNASYLDLNRDPNLYAYEIYRSVPPNFAARAIAAGARELHGPSEVPVEGEAAYLMDALGTGSYAWEYLATQFPLHYIDAYSYLAATAGDSAGSLNPKTAFMIVVRNGDGSMYWLSRPDSGYSVDNLPPPAPGSFIGDYVAGVTHLSWSPSGAPDVAGYRLYRGREAAFVPGPANLLVEQPELGHTDVAGEPFFYKLSAVDVHGNESVFTLLQPSGTVDVAGEALPRELALAAPSPNPARGGTNLRFALPRETRVSVALYDQQGRRVRVLLQGAAPAGEHALAWDGRDDAGRPVASGIYFVRLGAEGRTLTRRIVAIR